MDRIVLLLRYNSFSAGLSVMGTTSRLALVHVVISFFSSQTHLNGQIDKAGAIAQLMSKNMDSHLHRYDEPILILSSFLAMRGVLSILKIIKPA